MARSHLTTGAKVALFVNGKRYGRVTAFNWNSDTPKRAIYGVDSMQAFELAPTIARVSGSVSILKLSGDGGAEGAGMNVPFPDLANAKYFSVILVEIGTNVVIFAASKCSATSQSWGIVTRAYVTGTINFEAIEWGGETRPLSE